MMPPRQTHDDPLGEALAGGPFEPVAEPAEAHAPVMVDLNQFVTTAGRSQPDPVPAEPGEAEEDEPVVAYDDEARGGRVYNLLVAPRVNGELLDRVTMRMPEQGDIDAFFAGSVAGNRGMICRLTGLHPAVFARLKWTDAEALHQLYRDIAPSFVTGEE
jgi:hypothetical protein